MSEKKKKVSKSKAKKGKVLKFPARTTAEEVANVDMEAAKKLTGRSIGHIYRCINDGKLPAFKVGRTTVFRQSDLEKLMTPVPYTPTSERGYRKAKAKTKIKGKKAPKAKRSTRGGRRNSATKPSTRKAKTRTPGTKAATAKALEGMTTETAST
jgi:excisionase family DNA binding protein